MAREFAQIKLSIWADDDWRDLSPLARYLYMTLLTSPTLSHCGVADWRPTRIAGVNGMDQGDIEDCGGELVQHLYLVIDEGSEEALIRSFVRNDGLMKQPKMAVAMASAHAAVASKEIRGVVVHELKRLREDYPHLHGWGSEKATALLGLRSVDPSTYPLGKGSRKGKATPSTKGSPTPAPTPATTSSSLTPSQTGVSDTTAGAIAMRGEPFDLFWDAYSKKVARGAALKAWRKALTKADAETIITAAMQHTEWHKRANTEARFIPHPTTWLNEERWTDERGTPEQQRRADGDIDWDAAFARAQARDERNAS